MPRVSRCTGRARGECNRPAVASAITQFPAALTRLLSGCGGPDFRLAGAASGHLTHATRIGAGQNSTVGAGQNSTDCAKGSKARRPVGRRAPLPGRQGAAVATDVTNAPAGLQYAAAEQRCASAKQTKPAPLAEGAGRPGLHPDLQQKPGRFPLLKITIRDF